MSYILLTGATGFLGSNVLNCLLTITDYNIIALKRSFSDSSRIKNFLNNKRVVFVDSDIPQRDKAIAALFKDYYIEAVIHTATSYGRKDGCLSDVLDTNLALPIEILKAASAAGTKCFINTDSYYNKFDASYRPLLDYSLSKHAFSLWLKACGNKIKGVNIMLEHIFGPNDGNTKFTEFLLQEIAVKKAASVNLSPGGQKRDFIYVKDAAAAYISILRRALKEDFSFIEIGLGTGSEISIKDFAEKIKTISASHTQLNFGAIGYREYEIMSSKADISFLSGAGWKPHYTLDSAIKEMLDDAK